MSLIFGSGLLFVAFLVVFVGHIVLNRLAPPNDSEPFGWAEGLAFLFTVCISIGVSLIVAHLLANWGPAAIAGTCAAVGAAAAASAAVWLVLRRVAPREPERTAPLSVGQRRGRSAPVGSTPPTAARKRAA